MKRRVFSDEFKLEAVKLTQHAGVTKAQVAQELGISSGLLGRWARSLKDSGALAFPGKGNPRDAEMSALKRELARVKKERDFLREAATFFAREPK
jgi:transposase